MEQNPPEEERFITNVLDLAALIHDLATICWNAGVKDINPQMIIFAENYLESYDKIKLIEAFIIAEEQTIEDKQPSNWEKIREHDEKFFIENAHLIFKQLPIDSKNINAFKIFFTSKDSKGKNIIGEDDRNAIWIIFESLVKICIKYVHKVRGVKLVSTENGMRPAYVNKKFSKIKVRELAKLWNIDLMLPE